MSEQVKFLKQWQQSVIISNWKSGMCEQFSWSLQGSKGAITTRYLNNFVVIPLYIEIFDFNDCDQIHRLESLECFNIPKLLMPQLIARLFSLNESS